MEQIEVANFDFNLFFNRTEMILRKYEDIETVELYYHIGQRFPIDKSKMCNAGIRPMDIRNRPFYPVYAAKLFKLIFLFKATTYNIYNELIFDNPICKKSNSLYPAMLKDITDSKSLIYNVYPLITQQEVDMILEDMSIAIRDVVKVIELDSLSIYGMDIEGRNFIIHKYADIRAIRFSELIGESFHDRYTTT